MASCTFRAGDAAEALREVQARRFAPAVVAINPPRSGCEPAVLAEVTRLRPRAVIYVSCNPETLARDLDILAGRGFRTTDVQPVDMFPQTVHVESVVRLQPAP